LEKRKSKHDYPRKNNILGILKKNWGVKIFKKEIT